jgi:hypothetical protein
MVPVVQDTIKIPWELVQAQYEIVLAIDTCFVNKMVFFHAIAEKIVYWTSQWVPDGEVLTYRESRPIASTWSKYSSCTARPVSQLHMQAHRNMFLLLSASIRTLKECCRATIQSNPFAALPWVLLKTVVQECTRKLNYFPSKGWLQCLLLSTGDNARGQAGLSAVMLGPTVVLCLLMMSQTQPTRLHHERWTAFTCVLCRMHMGDTKFSTWKQNKLVSVATSKRQPRCGRSKRLLQ